MGAIYRLNLKPSDILNLMAWDRSTGIRVKLDANTTRPRVLLANPAYLFMGQFQIVLVGDSAITLRLGRSISSMVSMNSTQNQFSLLIGLDYISQPKY